MATEVEDELTAALDDALLEDSDLPLAAEAAEDVDPLAIEFSVLSQIVVPIVKFGLKVWQFKNEFDDEVSLKKQIVALCLSRFTFQQLRLQLGVVIPLVGAIKDIAQLENEYRESGNGPISQNEEVLLEEKLTVAETNFRKSFAGISSKYVWQSLREQDEANNAYTADDPSLEQIVTGISKANTVVGGQMS